MANITTLVRCTHFYAFEWQRRVCCRLIEKRLRAKVHEKHFVPPCCIFLVYNDTQKWGEVLKMRDNQVQCPTNHCNIVPCVVVTLCRSHCAKLLDNLSTARQHRHSDVGSCTRAQVPTNKLTFLHVLTRDAKCLTSSRVMWVRDAFHSPLSMLSSKLSGPVSKSIGPLTISCNFVPVCRKSRLPRGLVVGVVLAVKASRMTSFDWVRARRGVAKCNGLSAVSSSASLTSCWSR